MLQPTAHPWLQPCVPVNPIHLNGGTLTTERTANAAAQGSSPTSGRPWGAYAMFWTVDDLAKIATLFQNNGAYNSTQLIDRNQTLAAMQRLTNRLVPSLWLIGAIGARQIQLAGRHVDGLLHGLRVLFVGGSLIPTGHAWSLSTRREVERHAVRAFGLL